MDGLFAVETMLPKLHIRIGGLDEGAHEKMVSGSYFFEAASSIWTAF